MGSTNGILGSQVDAISTWDMPDNDLHGMVDVPLHEETSTAYGDGSRSAGSHITICGSELSRTSLYRCGASSGTYHRMCEREREALEKAERFKVDKFARDLYERLMKLKRRMEGLESEEEKDARILAEQCQQSALYLKIMSGNDSTTDLASVRSNPLRRFLDSVSSHASLASSRKSSKISTPSTREASAAGYARLHSSTTSIESTCRARPLRERTISLPLEHDSAHRRRPHHRQSSTSSNKPVFNLPIYDPKPEPEPISGEIFRVITNPAKPSEPPCAIYPNRRGSVHRLSCSSTQPLRSRTYSRMSTSQGHETIAEIREIDARGRKNVRFEWGTAFDQVIPHFWHERKTGPARAESGSDNRTQLKRLKQRCESVKEELRDGGRKILSKVKSLRNRGEKSSDAVPER